MKFVKSANGSLDVAQSSDDENTEDDDENEDVNENGSENARRGPWKKRRSRGNKAAIIVCEIFVLLFFLLTAFMLTIFSCFFFFKQLTGLRLMETNWIFRKCVLLKIFFKTLSRNTQFNK